jgi:hypothetical protein
MLQAAASTESYEALWSGLKSMRHALERAMKMDELGAAAELDGCRLRALAGFLRREFDPPSAAEDSGALDLADPRFALNLDVRPIVKEVQAFQDWRRHSKMGAKEKMLRLIAALEDYEKSRPSNLFPRPPEEFQVLHAVLSELLLRIEVELAA